MTSREQIISQIQRTKGIYSQKLLQQKERNQLFSKQDNPQLKSPSFDRYIDAFKTNERNKQIIQQDHFSSLIEEAERDIGLGLVGNALNKLDKMLFEGQTSLHQDEASKFFLKVINLCYKHSSRLISEKSQLQKAYLILAKCVQWNTIFDFGNLFEYTNILINFGTCLKRRGKTNQSIKSFTDALELLIKIKSTQRLAEIYFNLAQLTHKIGDHESSLDFARKSVSQCILEIKQQPVQKNSIETPSYLGYLFEEKGSIDGEEEDEWSENSSQNLLFCYCFLAQKEEYFQQFEIAKGFYMTALEYSISKFGIQHSLTQKMQLKLACFKQQQLQSFERHSSPKIRHPSSALQKNGNSPSIAISLPTHQNTTQPDILPQKPKVLASSPYCRKQIGIDSTRQLSITQKIRRPLSSFDRKSTQTLNGTNTTGELLNNSLQKKEQLNTQLNLSIYKQIQSLTSRPSSPFSSRPKILLSTHTSRDINTPEDRDNHPKEIKEQGRQTEENKISSINWTFATQNTEQGDQNTGRQYKNKISRKYYNFDTPSLRNSTDISKGQQSKKCQEIILSNQHEYHPQKDNKFYYSIPLPGNKKSPIKSNPSLENPLQTNNSNKNRTRSFASQKFQSYLSAKMENSRKGNHSRDLDITKRSKPKVQEVQNIEIDDRKCFGTDIIEQESFNDEVMRQATISRTHTLSNERQHSEREENIPNKLIYQASDCHIIISHGINDANQHSQCVGLLQFYLNRSKMAIQINFYPTKVKSSSNFFNVYIHQINVREIFSIHQIQIESVLSLMCQKIQAFLNINLSHQHISISIKQDQQVPGKPQIHEFTFIMEFPKYQLSLYLAKNSPSQSTIHCKQFDHVNQLPTFNNLTNYYSPLGVIKPEIQNSEDNGANQSDTLELQVNKFDKKSEKSDYEIQNDLEVFFDFLNNSENAKSIENISNLEYSTKINSIQLSSPPFSFGTQQKRDAHFLNAPSYLADQLNQ